MYIYVYKGSKMSTSNFWWAPTWQKVLAWFQVRGSRERINLLNSIPSTEKRESFKLRSSNVGQD